MAFTGHGIYRVNDVSMVPQGSVAERLLAGAYGPHPFQNAPPGFGGLAVNRQGDLQQYGGGSQALAAALAGMQELAGRTPPPAPAEPEQAPAAAPDMSGIYRDMAIALAEQNPVSVGHHHGHQLGFRGVGDQHTGSAMAFAQAVTSADQLEALRRAIAAGPRQR